MKTTNKIKFICERESKYSGKYYDVMYRLNRRYTYFPEELPKTAVRFIEEAKFHREQKVRDIFADSQQTVTEIIHTNAEFTGLADKNGNMIFEGDIIKIKSGLVDFDA